MQPRNPFICLAIVVTIGVTLLIGVAGMVLLSVNRIDVPASLVAIISTAIGSLSSFLVSVPRGSAGIGDPPPPVSPERRP